LLLRKEIGDTYSVGIYRNNWDIFTVRFNAYHWNLSFRTRYAYDTGFFGVVGFIVDERVVSPDISKKRKRPKADLKNKSVPFVTFVTNRLPLVSR
jgi:hypothetical protein